MFYVERNHPELGWKKVMFTQHRTRAYCDGYVDAFDSLYPSQPLRIIKVEKDNTIKIVRETKGRGKVELA